MKLNRIKVWLLVTVSGLLLITPPIALVLDEPFYLTVIGRIMIFAIAALSLDLILGFGGMISLGHAAYLGIGAYAVGILSFYGINNAWLQLPVAIFGSAIVAFIIGIICLRTSGIYFIMITLAMTQLLYFLGISLETYGGDDGLPIDRSIFFEAFDLGDEINLYYLIFAFLVITTLFSWRLINSRFGVVIRGAQENEMRMHAIGFSTFRYKLLAFTIAGSMCGLSGFLYANLNEFVTPEYMHWFRSGEIMIMVLVGGMGTLFGPLFGAAAYLLFEDIISGWTEHWMVIFGPLLVLLVLFAKKGLWGFLPDRDQNDA